PQILMEEELHAPDLDASGVAFVGINFYVLLGRGQDYAWSATSAGQDIVDTFAERLCEPGGGKPTVNSMHYVWKGRCRPIEVLDKVNDITPNLSDPSPAETYRLQAQRTVHGVVSQRGKVDGAPVAFTRLRSTYFHEGDSALGFSKFNTPSKIRNARDFQEAADDIGFTFNWFYADDRDIGYYNSGFNPVRAKGTDPEFPNWGTGKYDWKGWDALQNISRRTSFDAHPQVINQGYITSWNNKPAPGYTAPEDTYGYGSIHRSQSLDERIESGIAGARKLSLVGLINAMEDAGTVDLRGSQALPWMLKVLVKGKGGAPADLRDEVAALSSWVNRGAHRRDADRSGVYDAARAVALMDAWWPRALETIFKPKLGNELFTKLRSKLAYDDPPSAQGSAYFSGWYAYVEKDLRALLGRKVVGGFSRSYCGKGKSQDAVLDSCKAQLASSLRAASRVPGSTLYPRGDNCATGDAQLCNDAVRFQTTGGIGVKEIHWINRPTWQQVVEVLGHRGRGTELRCSVPRTGSNASERLQGSAFPDSLVAKGGDDLVLGEGGDDCLSGGSGDDQLHAGGGADSVKGGSGDDRISAADGKRDTISCGAGEDRVSADARDRISGDCEQVDRPAGKGKAPKKKR
ncbi:MAG: penicillin acylase family protein, partial [Actinomycetota bacterium]|nr:penicillin acylase family protein [Actinomycetota bacterium]